MSDAKFTPGPWKVGVMGGRRMRAIYRAHESGGNYSHEIATLRGDPRGREENVANARLIAAAPELYAALQHCLEHLQFIRDHGTGLIAEGNDAVNEGLAALAKADGR